MPEGQNNYDFILNDQPRAGRKLPVPSLNNPVALISMLLFLTVIIAIGGAILGSKKTKIGGITDVLGQSQEINRVSAEVTPQLTDSDARSVAATAQSMLTSDQSQIKLYATAHKIKVDPKKLLTYQNSSTDQAMSKALSTNSLDSTYETYLHDALVDYQKSLSAAYDGTKDLGMKSLLQESYQSTKTLLASTPLKSRP